jgi:hypothetical protein
VKRFFVTLVIATFTIVAATLILRELQLLEMLPSFFWQTVILLFVTTGVIFLYLYQADEKNFITLYLLTMIVKLLAYVGYNFIVIYQSKAGATANVVFFMVTYFVFTLLEIIFLYPKITRNG